MWSLFGKIFDLIFGKNERERESGIFYLKSLMFLVVIVVFISDIFFWKMSHNVSNMLGEKVIGYILDVVRLGAHFFTSLTILSLIVMSVASMLCLILNKVTKKAELTNYFRRVRMGSEFRFTYSLEDVMLCLAIGYLFDRSFVQEYIKVYTDFIWICVFIAGAFEFFFSSIKGVINRFFLLQPILGNRTEDKSE